MENSHTPSKRRRLNAAAALSRPFKSPLRKPDSTVATCSPSLKTAEESKTLSGTTTTTVRPERQVSDSEDLHSRESLPNEPARSKSSLKRSISGTPLQSPRADPDLIRLQKEERALQARLAVLRDELNMTKEAMRIEVSSKDSELENLIIKWRHASQEAADEVFAGAQERVARMGGLQAWMQRSRQDTFNWDNDEKPTGPSGDGDGDGQSCDRSDVFVDESDCHKNDHPDSSLEEFTMGFMLKTMNIDERLIGWDSVTEKWTQE